MKFGSVTEVQQFLLEIGKGDICESITSPNYEPSNEELETFIKGRSELTSTIKNAKKSSSQKFNWLKNRSKLMRGISRFHKSADGKKFHRKLGRFLATRVTEGHEDHIFDKNDHLVALNSLKQHLLLELQYYKPVLEAVETEIMIMDYALPLINKLEEGILNNKVITDEELVFISDMVSRKHFLDSLSELSGQSFSKLTDLCENIDLQINESKSGKDDHLIFLQMLKKEIHGSNNRK